MMGARRVAGHLARGLVFAALAAALLSGTAAADLTRIDPDKHAGKRRILIGENKKPSSYYRASQAEPIEFTLQGPVPLRVLARHYSPRPNREPMRLRIEVDGEEAWAIRLEARASGSAQRSDGGPVGVMRRGEVQIPAGEHRIRIYPVGGSRSALVRVFKGAPRKTRTSWVPFAPQKFEKAVILHGQDSETTYYRFNQEVPIGMKVHGPLRLKVTTRLDFDEVAGTTQSYVVRVLLDGEPWKVFPLTSRTSPTVMYPDLPEITPGIAREFTVKVPDGVHDVEMYLNSTTADGASAKIRAPASELRAGEPSR